MLRIIDRYVVREILLPFFLGLLVFTFVLEMPPILQQGERLIEKGVEWSIVARVLVTLLPQALGITIPMAVLLGILIALGRMSADREFVALQACGVSIFRLLRPIAAVAIVATAATAYVMIVALPNANQTFREITFNVVASRAESDVKPRVFFEDFPKQVVYVRDVTPDGTWRDVFVADSTQGNTTAAYFARQGRLLIDRDKKTVALLLERGTRHTTYLDKPEEYEGGSFDRLLLSLDAETVFPRTQLLKGDNEMTIAELRASIADAARRGTPAYRQIFTIQQKYSIPVACLVLALIGLALGASHRKDGKLASFVIGFAVIFVYYVLLWTSRALADGGHLSAALAPWIPNIVLGAAGVVLLLWRLGAADQPIRISIPTLSLQRTGAAAAGVVPKPAAASRVVVVVRIPHLNLPRPRLLDLYVSRQYLRIFCLGVVALLGIFYISTFMDLAEHVFRGTGKTALFVRYLYFQTPQYVYFIVPMAALIAALVTIGVLTKNSELIVMRACGVSLYRSAVPVVLFAIVFSGVLFELQERVLAFSNREATRLSRLIRGLPAQTFGVLDRRWVVGQNGDIYHYDFFDPGTNTFSRLSMFDLDHSAWRLDALTYARDVALVSEGGAAGRASVVWKGHQGWRREFTVTRRRNTVRSGVIYAPFAERNLALEPPSYFKSEEPDADRMTYGELKHYIGQLRAGGYHVVPYQVQLQRKVAFPFVTLIMTLIAVPFAVSTGRRGALYGIGVGIVLAIVYWTTLSIFGALGAGGVITPTLAAWAPNILFGAVAAYLLLTVRT